MRSGYFLKEGLANNEDFYYLNLLITITASNEEDLEWKVSEMKKLLLSQDMNACTCPIFGKKQRFYLPAIGGNGKETRMSAVNATC